MHGESAGATSSGLCKPPSACKRHAPSLLKACCQPHLPNRNNQIPTRLHSQPVTLGFKVVHAHRSQTPCAKHNQVIPSLPYSSVPPPISLFQFRLRPSIEALSPCTWLHLALPAFSSPALSSFLCLPLVCSVRRNISRSFLLTVLGILSPLIISFPRSWRSFL